MNRNIGRNEREPLAVHVFRPGRVSDVLSFLKRTRSELRLLRRVRVWRDRIQVFDVNGDFFEVRQLGYPLPEVTQVLDTINTAYKREAIHDDTDEDYKEFKTGRRYAWAADRVM